MIITSMTCQLGTASMSFGISLNGLCICRSIFLAGLCSPMTICFQLPVPMGLFCQDSS
jgi:hypothetical protein